jgi:hypothetical protein
MTDNDFETSLNETIKHLVNRVFPKNNKYRYIILFFNIIHVLFGFMIAILLFISPRYQLYVSLFYSIVMASWRIFDGCLITIVTNYFSDFEGAFLENFNWDYMYFILISISLYFYFVPKHSFFTLMYNIFIIIKTL